MLAQGTSSVVFGYFFRLKNPRIAGTTYGTGHKRAVPINKGTKVGSGTTPLTVQNPKPPRFKAQ